MGRRPRGALPDWRPRTARQAGILADLVARYEQHHEEDTLPRGPRGIFYDLRPNGMGNGVTYRKPDSEHPIRGKLGVPGFGPMEAHPEAVREVLVLARRAGIIPEHWVADARAPAVIEGFFYESARDYAESAIRTIHSYMAGEDFALDQQRGQPVYIEVLCEAEDLQPRLARVALEGHGVPVYSGAGYDGLKGKRAFAERALEREAPTVVLQVADRDDDGDKIFRAAAEDAIAWADDGETLRFERLALTTEQAEEHSLLDADGKAEVDGLPVPVLDRIVTDAIEELQDPARRDSLKEAERRQRERLPDLIRTMLAEDAG